MHSTSRNLTAIFLLPALLIAWVPVAAGPESSGARLEGLLTGVDGRPATGLTVHLIDGDGTGVGQVTSDRHGIYSFRGLPQGRYSLGIENPLGQMAPVVSAPVQLGGRQLARRDVKLVQVSPAQAHSMTQANYGLGMWWAGLSTPAKAWTVVGLVAIVAITVVALSDDDEPATSPYYPD